MKKPSIPSRAALWVGVLAIPLLNACGSIGTLEWSSADAGYTALFDGNDLNQWKPVGNANWRLQDGLLLADLGSGFLVTRQNYQDFQLKVDFWVDPSANSGIYILCTDLQNITDRNAYEVNIFDQRPDPSFGTGAIVDVPVGEALLGRVVDALGKKKNQGFAFFIFTFCLFFPI